MSRGLRTVVGASLVLLAVAGCARHNDAAPGGKAPEAVVRSLGGTPDNTYQQKILYKPLGASGFSVEEAYLVPSPDGKGFRVVDSRGDVYSDYSDFLLHNTLSR